jgi:serine/threonine protein kinase
MFKGGSPITIGDKEYTIVKQIGEGGYSLVYLATNGGKQYALKIIESNSKNDLLTENEMNILKKLQPVCDEFILCVTDYAKIHDFHYIVTEYLDGYIDLFTYVLERPDIEPTDDQYVKIIDNLCKGLLKIHEQGIAHRDIKLENIMIHPYTLDIKYIDFGFSCSNNNTDSRFNQICKEVFISTQYYDYSIQDQEESDYFKVLQKGDIWSLGMTIFMLIEKSLRLAFYPIENGNDYRKFKNKISNYKNKDLSIVEIKNVLDKAVQLYNMGKTQHKHTLDLVKAFSSHIDERIIE